MTYRDEVIRKIKSHTSYLSTQFGVKRIGLFGSVAEARESDESDIDLIVEFDRPLGLKFITLTEYLESLLGRKVDLITREGLRNIRVKSVASDIENHIIYV